MSADISAAIGRIEVPVDIVVGEHDQVEHEIVLRPLFSRLLPLAPLTVVPGVGHLLPLEAPQVIAAYCARMVAAVA